MAIRIEPVDTCTAPESTLRAMHELAVLRDQEERPFDVIPYVVRAGFWRHLEDDEVMPRWIAWDGEVVVAHALSWMHLEEDLENGFFHIFVHPGYRRRGLFRELAKPLFDRFEAEHRVRIMTTIPDGGESESLLERGGMKPVYTERLSRLLMADIDWGLMEEWVERVSERATGYDLISLTSPVPDEHLQDVVDAWNIIHTAPKEDVIEEDIVFTPERWRNIEEVEAAREVTLHHRLVVHCDSGAPVGFTTLATQARRPEQAWQWGTAVDPAHRNKGLGRLVKASMILFARDAYPEIEYIDTDNADSNAPMLGINVEMGYKEVHKAKVWQGLLKDARENLHV